MFPVLFRVGPFTLHTYGLFVASGFLFGLYFLRREFDRQGIPPYLVDRLAFYLLISGLIGARIVYFGFEGMDDLKRDPFSFFRIWEGGLVFYGGLMGALVTSAVFARVHEIEFLTLTDALATPLLLGQGIGRLGCFSAGCCYGKETTSILSVVFTHPESLAPRFVSLIPIQIYSSLGLFVLFFLALHIGKKNYQQGILASFYLAGYGVFRFFVEFFRGDERGEFFHGFSPSQWIALFLIAVGVGLAVYVKKREST